MTTNMQMYISYLHSRLQQGVLIISKYVGHHAERRAPSAERRGGFVCLAHTEACRFLALLTYFLTNLLQIPKVQPRNSMNVL